MNEDKKLLRFSKKIVIFCVVANVLITAAFIVLLYRGVVLDGLVVAAVYAPFTLELGFNCMISVFEKMKGHDDETE